MYNGRYQPVNYRSTAARTFGLIMLIVLTVGFMLLLMMYSPDTAHGAIGLF
jgi:hypothetical protein